MKLSQFLSEARTVAGEAASKRGLSHAGHGYYADRQGNIVAKSVGGERLVAVDKSEAQQAQQGAEQGSAEDAHKEENGGEGLGHIALTFGRFNPPTIGHEKLLDTVAAEGADNYRIYPSRTVDRKSNPLEPESKIQFMQSMFSEHSEAIVNDADMSNIFNVLTTLNQEGYSGVTMVVGSDRVSEFKGLLEKYNGVAYDFEELEVVSGGERDPDAEGVEGMSASKMRAFAAEGNIEEFSKGVPSGFKDVKKLMKEVRVGMGLPSEVETPELEKKEVKELWKIAPKLAQDDLREAYISEEVFSIGTLVEHTDTGVRGEIVQRGTNYATFQDEHGWEFKVWLTSLTEVVEKHPSVDDGPDGNDWKVGQDTIRTAIQAMTPGQPVKKFSDFRKTTPTK
tara:strand:+ start:689 stop:1870 length:1182 start_codon:yes stop_codon:yes gene_type:complete